MTYRHAIAALLATLALASAPAGASGGAPVVDARWREEAEQTARIIRHSVV